MILGRISITCLIYKNTQYVWQLQCRPIIKVELVSSSLFLWILQPDTTSRSYITGHKPIKKLIFFSKLHPIYDLFTDTRNQYGNRLNVRCIFDQSPWLSSESVSIARTSRIARTKERLSMVKSSPPWCRLMCLVTLVVRKHLFGLSCLPQHGHRYLIDSA